MQKRGSKMRGLLPILTSVGALTSFSKRWSATDVRFSDELDFGREHTVEYYYSASRSRRIRPPSS